MNTLKTTSPRYLKRLVREINRLGDIFYFAPIGFNDAHLGTKAKLIHDKWLKAYEIRCYMPSRHDWVVAQEGTAFLNRYGKPIVASLKGII